jgi:hypothetical protein
MQGVMVVMAAVESVNLVTEAASITRGVELASRLVDVGRLVAEGLPAREVAIEVGSRDDGEVRVHLPFSHRDDAVVAAGLLAWAAVLTDPVFAVCRSGRGYKGTSWPMVEVRGVLDGVACRVQGHLDGPSPVRLPARKYEWVAVDAAAVRELAAGVVSGVAA